MSSEHYIAGDWGTSRLRLSLCLDDSVLETRQGPGIGALREPAGEALRPLLAGWRQTHGPLPILLCGMAGSRNGWREAPYLPCPVDLRSLGAAALRFEADEAPVAIAPGLSCRSALGVPEVMRGEETQIAGAIALHPGLGTGRHLLCLPGTHTKWANLQDGQVCDFLTALTGELFALLRDGSTLMRAAPAGTEARAHRVSPRTASSAASRLPPRLVARACCTVFSGCAAGSSSTAARRHGRSPISRAC